MIIGDAITSFLSLWFTRGIFGIFDSSPVQGPAVVLDKGTFKGVASESRTVEGFLGIPFAQPPVGDLRFRSPVPTEPYSGLYDASKYGNMCIQGDSRGPDDEDCLFLNVIKPATVPSGSSLPVVFWIFGGGFVDGDSSWYNGTAVVARSLEIGMPVIYVSINHRLHGLGFPQGKETRQAGNGNLGLQDQRLALHWVQKYISAFGGDPSKVTIWGVSAGAISVAAQMQMNNGDPGGLFRAAFAQSGSPLPIGTVEEGQPQMNKFATALGCAHTLGSPTVFDCMRKASADDIRTALGRLQDNFNVDRTVGWFPNADGTTLPTPMQHMLLHSKIANVPLVSGVCDDEGTMWAINNLDILTSAQLEDYLTDHWSHGNRTFAVALMEAYPEDPRLGCPFDTGMRNVVTPQFKRIAAMTGDFIFNAPRRLLFREIVNRQPVFSYVNKRLKNTPVMGAYHGSDVDIVFRPDDMTDYLVRFATTLDPNGGNTNASQIYWPQYTFDEPKMLTFLDEDSLAITEDTFRKEGIQIIIDLSLSLYA
ncbi:Alpha/Beta hydrolase protein [Vararia minispora EC-137]|uniref:Alpha/Beta hydrolase protein n=1 Tax=Vararia minispora EC-137 TaxID=1314806 RepID=A0ACB8QW66_9AGAM|nr:Alpha/Beta hydrolase protein [Vararia minispora EC-137]